MSRESISFIERQRLGTFSEPIKQAFMLLSVLKDLLYLLLLLLRENVSLEDARARLEVLKADCVLSSDGARNDSPLSSTPASHKGELTCDIGDRSTAHDFVSAVRKLCRAIVQRDVKVITRILEVEPRLAAQRHEGGWYPIHAAVLTGDLELVRSLLLFPKVDVNAMCISTSFSVGRERELGSSVDNIDGASPLHFSCMTGNIDIIRLLVEHGASMKANDSKQRRPIEYFDFDRHSGVVSAFKDLYVKWKEREEFFKVHNDVDGLAKLIKKDKYEVFEQSLKKNPHFATRMTYHDFTLLHLAVVRQRSRFVELLISMDKSVVNKRDRCYHSSLESSHSSFAPVTIPHRHVSGATPLHYACLVKNMDIAKMLLEAGADWDIKDSQGRLAEDLIQRIDETDNEVKSTFVRLRDAEEEKRKENREKAKKDEGDKRRDDESDYCSEAAGVPALEILILDGSHVLRLIDENKKVPTKVSMESLLLLEDRIGDKLVGQRGPIRLIANTIRLREGGWIDPDRPLAMLFLGSSGVGKTELAKQLALYLHGKDGMSTDKGQDISKLENDHGFVRIDMSEFQERHTVFNLIGAPKSYVGYHDGGALTQPLKKNPKAVVLLDEIEKAHPDVLNTFLQVFDDGRITDSKDGTISCKDAIFIMTSNIAGEEIKNAAPRLRQLVEQSEKGGRPESYVHYIQDFTRSIRPQLKCHLRRDEFIGRINQIVVFLPLNQEEIEVVVQRELAMWCKRAEEKHKIQLTWSDEVVRKLAGSYDVNYGVRSVANEVQRIALQLVADAHIRGQISDNWRTELMINEVGDIIMKGCARPEDGIDIFSDFLWSFED
ncbi:hypothetical protein ACEPAF_1055 [Sanghuangporus sanghuang]